MFEAASTIIWSAFIFDPKDFNSGSGIPEWFIQFLISDDPLRYRHSVSR